MPVEASWKIFFFVRQGCVQFLFGLVLMRDFLSCSLSWRADFSNSSLTPFTLTMRPTKTGSVLLNACANCMTW